MAAVGDAERQPKGARMSGFPPIAVRQPQPYDIVDDPVRACGIGTGFEGQFAARVRDGHGAQIAEVPVNAGGTGVWGNYDVTLPVGVPPTAQGTLEVFEFSPKGDGSELNKVVVPITFGPALLNPYHGFAQYTVVGGDTLSGIAHKYYNDANRWPRIFEANRHQIQDPDRIFPGQVLRIPQ
jgi:nucleoid-associated protein YgaU